MNITQARAILRQSGLGARKLHNFPASYNVTWNGRVWFTIDISKLNAQSLQERIERELPNIKLENCL